MLYTKINKHIPDYLEINCGKVLDAIKDIPIDDQIAALEEVLDSIKGDKYYHEIYAKRYD